MHLPHWHYQRLPGLSGIFLNAALRTFALGLATVFIPIFIWQQTGQMGLVFLFYFFLSSFQLIFLWPLARFLSVVGPDWAMAFSLFALAGFFLSLLLVQRALFWLIFAAALGAIPLSLYWLPYHLAFIRLGHYHLGEKLGAITIITRLAAALAPALGGFAAHYWHFRFLWGLVVALLLLAVLPLFGDNYAHREVAVPFMRVWRFYRPRLSLATAFLAAGLEAIFYGVAWPIFVYSRLHHLTSLGLISTLALLLSVLFAWQVGRLTNRYPRNLLQLGSKLNALNWLFKSLANSPYLLGIFDALYQLVGVFVWIPFTFLTYRAARRQPFAFLLGRAFFIGLGMWLAVLGIWLLVSWRASWWFIFALGSVAVLGLQQINHSYG